MFFNAEDDDQDFMTTGGSKLANLFGMDKASGQGGNASLTYTAPKQPKKKDSIPDAAAAAAPTVVLASVVHAYKYIDNKYASQGKLGAALLATQATKDYRILLYVNKQQQVTNARITSSFAFNIQQNNYASFYDDASQMWSIMFDNTESAEKFSKEIALAKYNAGPQSDLVQQELSLGEGGGLENGDSAEVKYTGSLFTNGTFGKVFDQSVAENYFRFKVGKGKVIKGWDQGMLGMKKGGKRLLIIPPSLAYGPQGVSERIPPNSTLIFEVQVVRVKLQKGESPQETPAPTPGPTPLSSFAQVPDQDELDVRGRTKSINDHLSQSPDSGKAKLISRMARMGQPMLPFQGAVAAQPDDSDEEMYHQVQQAVSANVKPPLPSKPRSGSGTGSHLGQVIMTQAQPAMMHPGVTMVGSQPVVVTTTTDLLQQQQQQQPAFLQNIPGAQQVAVYQNPNTFLQQQQQAALLQQQQLLQQQLLGQGLSAPVGAMPGQPSAFGVPVAPVPTPTPQTPSADALAPVLLTETRQQNTEVRIGLSKMSDKVDKILEKMEHLSAGGLGPHVMGMITPYGSNLPAPSMEANVLMQNITRIVQENERLKKEVYEQSNKVQELNDRIASLLDKNQKYVEQSQNLLEQRNEGYKHTASQSQARVLALEQEKVQLATELSTSSAQITTLQLELGEFRKREGELKQQLQMTTSTSSYTKEELDRLRLQKDEDEQKISTLTASVRDEKLARKGLEAKLASFQEELTEIRSANESLEKNLSERKRKSAEERRKLEEDLEDSKIHYEQTIEGLREKLRKQKTSVDADTQSKMSKIEEEISRDWQAKSDRMMAAIVEKHNRQLADLRDEKEDLIQKVDELEKKLQAVRSSGSSTELQITHLEDELAEMKVWKDKYEGLRSQAATMKERYEKRIGELEGEKENEQERKSEIIERAREQRQEQQQKIQQLQQEIQQLQTQLSTSRATVQQNTDHTALPGADVSTEVKKIMNSVYQTLRTEFDAEEQYQGSEVLSTILGVIKQTTLKLVNQPAVKHESSEEEEEEDEDEDEKEKDEFNKAEETKVKSGSYEKRDQDITTSEEDKTRVHSPISTEEEVATTGSIKTELQNEDSSKINQRPEAKQVDTVETEPDKILPATSSPLERVTLPVDENVAPKDSDHVKDFSNENGTEVRQPMPVHRDDNISEVMVPNNDQTVSSSITDNRTHNVKELENGLHEGEQSTAEVTSELQSTPEKDEADMFTAPNSNTSAAEDDVKVMNGGRMSPPISESSEEGKITDQNKQAQPEIHVKAVPKPANDTREPPPLFDDDDDSADSSLFGNVSTPSGRSSASNSYSEVKPAIAKTTPTTGLKEKTTPGKKVDQANDEDLKPQPPPPLFGDDSDDDDLDWLS